LNISALYETLLEKAEAHGFPIRGGLDIDSAQGDLALHVERYDQWLAQGFDGKMAYLRRGRDRRADPRLVFPKAQSIFCVAAPYRRAPLGDGNGGPRYARYIQGRDYHDRILERLERLLQEARADHPSLEWKICVDTSAVLERSWATLAGLGWIGKNKTLIHPKHGSYLFIAEALLSAPLGRGPSPLPNYCGNCTRCLDACPTRAFSSSGALDSRRCISYWTLENRGALEISDEEREKIGPWVAGCDICQEVCPFNIKPSREAQPEFEIQGESAASVDWLSLLRETPDQYRERVRDSALNRVKPEQFSRNLAIVFANAGPEAWTPDAREEAVRRSCEETDPAARAEWERTVSLLTSLQTSSRKDELEPYPRPGK